MRRVSIELALLATVLLAAALVAGGCASTTRPARNMEDLLSARRADDTIRELQTRELMERLVKRAESKVRSPAGAAKAAAQPTIDVLVISGGGDWGAFGAGVLKGWGRVKGELARPQFDVVTGVSTGALIAPFAFLGDDAVHRPHRPAVPQSQRGRGGLARDGCFFLPRQPVVLRPARSGA